MIGRLDVEDASALMAQEMGVRFSHPIVVGIFAVDGEHTHHTVLHKKAERVVNCCLGKGRNMIHQGLINLVYGGVSHLLQKILHHGHTLHGYFHAVCREIVVDLFFLHKEELLCRGQIYKFLLKNARSRTIFLKNKD